MRTLLMLLCAGGIAACSPGSGAILLEARQGRVLDRDTGSAIPSADVFQVYWGRGVVGEPRPAYALRWSTSDSAGEFDFAQRTSPELKTWVLETDAAEYGFYHPNYGLVRSGLATNNDLELQASQMDDAGREANFHALCGSRPPDSVVAEAASRHCATRSRP